MEQSSDHLSEQLFRRFQRFGIMPEAMLEMKRSWQYEVFAALIRGIESKCRWRTVKVMAKVLFRIFQKRERDLKRHLSPDDQFQLHKLIGKCFPAYKKAFELL